MSDPDFTHLDPMGRARMVDVTPKEPTHRRGVARGVVHMKPETTTAIANREVKKGDVLAVARVAAIQAAKRTSDMIPLCHPLLIGAVSVACLTIYDMCKSADRGMVIGEIALWEKSGGRSGTYRRPANIASVVTNVVET